MISFVIFGSDIFEEMTLIICIFFSNQSYSWTLGIVCACHRKTERGILGLFLL